MANILQAAISVVAVSAIVVLLRLNNRKRATNDPGEAHRLQGALIGDEDEEDDEDYGTEEDELVDDIKVLLNEMDSQSTSWRGVLQRVLGVPNKFIPKLRPSIFSSAEQVTYDRLLRLFYHIAEDTSRDNGAVHRGVTCNLCSQQPIVGVRYKCANCLHYNLCETCEGTVTHLHGHVFFKIRIPAPPFSMPHITYRLLYPLAQGTTREPIHTVLSHDEIDKLCAKGDYEVYDIDSLYDQFLCVATAHWHQNSYRKIAQAISQRDYLRALGRYGREENAVIQAIFNFFDKNQDGVIDFGEYVTGITVLSNRFASVKTIWSVMGLENDNTLSYHSFRLLLHDQSRIVQSLAVDMMAQKGVDDLDEDIFMLGINEHGNPAQTVFPITQPLPFRTDQPLSAAFPVPQNETPNRLKARVKNKKDLKTDSNLLPRSEVSNRYPLIPKYIFQNTQHWTESDDPTVHAHDADLAPRSPQALPSSNLTPPDSSAVDAFRREERVFGQPASSDAAIFLGMAIDDSIDALWCRLIDVQTNNSTLTTEAKFTHRLNYKTFHKVVMDRDAEGSQMLTDWLYCLGTVL